MRNKNRNALTLTFVLLLGSVSGRTDADNGNGPHPRLDTPFTFTTTSSYRATGVDPLAPRLLVLWSWNGDRFSRVSSTMSGSGSRLGPESNGRFDFGEQSIPADGLTLHVAPLGVRADPARLLRVETPVTAPSVVSGGLESREIVFAPASPRGELRFYDADSGRLLLRKRIESNDRNRVVLDLEAELQHPWPTALLIEQSLEDGRRSARQFLYLD